MTGCGSGPSPSGGSGAPVGTTSTRAGGGDEQRRVVPAVHQRHRAVVVELGEHGGDEVLVAGDRPHHRVEVGGDGGQRLLGERRAAEGAEDRPGHLHRVQPLAPHVADDDAYAVRAGGHLVEVAADERLLRRRDVARGEAHRATSLGSARSRARWAVSAITVMCRSSPSRRTRIHAVRTASPPRPAVSATRSAQSRVPKLWFQNPEKSDSTSASSATAAVRRTLATAPATTAATA